MARKNACATFHPPPLDGSLTLPQLFDYHAAHTPQHPVFTYVDQAGTKKTIGYPLVQVAIHRAAKIVGRIMEASARSGQQDASPVVAILAVSDSYSYFALIVGILRAGLQAFPISIRNSDAAVAHLLHSSRATHMFVSHDSAMQALAQASVAKLVSLEPGTGSGRYLHPMPSFAHLYDATTPYELLPPMPTPDLNHLALIMHSSGSTAFPKPIWMSHRFLLQWALLPYYGEIEFCGKTLACHALPMFHAMGAIQIAWTAGTGMVMAGFSPYVGYSIPSPDNVLSAAVKTGSNFIFCVPSFVEHWARNPAHVASLKLFGPVIFAGGPLSQEVSDFLISENVQLIPFYGLTEVGAVTVVFPDGPDKDGPEYFKISPHCDPMFLPQEDAPDVCELVLLDCPTHHPAVLNFEIDNRKGYRTNDLLIRHPRNGSLWRVYGRTDDQIMHSTGEKTNPGPIESLIGRDLRIQGVVMFGRGRFHAGVLIEPASGYRVDPEDNQQVQEYRNNIWDSIERANKASPAHSRILKEMVLVAAPNKPFERTVKGTPRRAAVLTAYATEIDRIYEDFEESSQSDFDPPRFGDPEQVLSFVRGVVHKVVGRAFEDGNDMFQSGCDSLQATWIRNTLLHALRRAADVYTRDIPLNFVYDHPTILSLAAYLEDVYKGNGNNTDARRRAGVLRMKSLAHKYTSIPFPARRNSGISSAVQRDMVLLTGSTGRLGSHILASLLSDSTVSGIWALNRRITQASPSVLDRQTQTFTLCGLDVESLRNSKLTLIEGDLTIPDLGLDTDVYKAIEDSVTTIIHAAWRVDFNMSLDSLEPMVKGTRSLIDLALTSRSGGPRFLFISSVSVFRNWEDPQDKGAPESSVAPEVAYGSGYSESKWVAEKILETAGKVTMLRPLIVRVGQLTGGTNGSWNTSDWFPALVKTSQVLKCLPMVAGNVSWMHTNVAADAIVEMRKAARSFFNLAHPDPVPWRELVIGIASILSLPIASYDEWLEKLKRAAETPNRQLYEDMPALRLLDFFDGASIGDTSGKIKHNVNAREAFGLSPMDIDNALTAAPKSLSGGRSPSLDQEDVVLWLNHWKRVGFLS